MIWHTNNRYRWSYADRFLAELGLNMAAVEGRASKSVFGYAYWMFRDGRLPLLVSALTQAFAGIFGWAFRRPGPVRRLDLVLVLAVPAACGLVGAASLGSRAARQVPVLFADGFQNFPRVVVVKKDSDLPAFLAERGQLGWSTCLRKLFMDRPPPLRIRWLQELAGIAAEHRHPAAARDRRDRGDRQSGHLRPLTRERKPQRDDLMGMYRGPGSALSCP